MAETSNGRRHFRAAKSSGMKRGPWSGLREHLGKVLLGQGDLNLGQSNPFVASRKKGKRKKKQNKTKNHHSSAYGNTTTNTTILL